jgi:uncharacterized protein YjbJ (UPF0337 family)
MNWDQLHGELKQFSGGLKQKWGKLSGNPRTVAAGTRDLLAGRILERRGDSKQEAARQLQDFVHRNRTWSDLSDDNDNSVAPARKTAGSRLRLAR